MRFSVGLIDIALAVTTFLMLITDQTVLFFHLVFVLLAVGAFFWKFPSFAIRTLLWISVATTAILSAVYQGTTPIDELIEIPLLTLILLTVFAIARHRAQAQQRLTALNEQFALRLTELDTLNTMLHQEADTRARLQEEMLRAHEHYVQMVVHDLKNPLTGIMGFLDMLCVIGLTSDQQLVAESAKRSSTRMLDLVSNLLDVARFEEGRLDLRREPTDIGALLQECVDELRPLLDPESRPLSLSIADAMPPFAVDAGLLRRVITNLLSNAITHTAPGTEIRLSVGLDSSGGLRLSVADNGAGIPLEQQPALFERFSTLARSSAKCTSTGLGLAFCKLAVEAHGGTITVRSAPGAGTTFIIALALPPAEPD
jgi:signal transduction histidine kinase